MKIIVTGSLGHISKPLTQQLVQEGHTITVISSDAGKQKHIEASGATAAIGSLDDTAFLSATFAGADAVYCMVPPNYHQLDIDPVGFYKRIATSYVQAIQQSGIKKVVHLSSIGGHMESGSGLIKGHYEAEAIFKTLPEDVMVTTLRPVAFYYNLLSFIPAIKNSGIMASNYGGSDVTPWVAPYDIAMAAAEELIAETTGRKIRYVVSEELSCNELAAVLGNAIGKPGLQWVVVTAEEMLNRMKAAGMPGQFAQLVTEMNAAIHDGTLLADYQQNRPDVFGVTKLNEFAAEAFSSAYSK